MPPPLLILLISAIAWAGAQAQSTGPTTWAKRAETEKEVITTLQFYFHDIVSGPSPSAVRIAQPVNNITSPTFFGALFMIDDPLTVGPNLTSKTVGHARGMYGSASQADVGLIMALSFVFTDGEYDGSSFSLLSINPALQPVREMAVVGGTGLFRMARGYVIARTYWFDAKTGDAIVGYNATIVTYV